MIISSNESFFSHHTAFTSGKKFFITQYPQLPGSLTKFKKCFCFQQKLVNFANKNYLEFVHNVRLLRYSCLENSHPPAGGLLDFQDYESPPE